jgi:hypothetical protein
MRALDVTDNLIGTDVTGAAALPNHGDGILAEQGSDEPWVISGNVVSGNDFVGVHIRDGGSSLVVSDNWIGTNADGDALGNGGAGIRLEDGAHGVTISDSPATANTIAFNGRAGVEVVDDDSLDSSIRFNHIYGNTGLGIDLGADGVTGNDQHDHDDGPNGLQNYPTLSAAVPSGGRTDVTFRLEATANTTYVIDMYMNLVCDLSGHGEARLYLGNRVITTDATGSASATRSFRPAPPGSFVTATATSPGGATSELAACQIVT